MPCTTIADQDSPGLIRWQTRLLPLMSLLLIGLTVFFLGASVYQLYGLKTSIVSSPQPSLDKEMEALRPVQGDLTANTFDKTRLALLIRLEANVMERRYHQANTILLARVWTIYLGFLTGMILSLVGAAFILGKMRESSSQLDLSSHDWKAAMQSSSPGLVLAVLGAILMIVTVVARVEVKVEDRPLYITDLVVLPTPTPSEEGNDKEVSTGKESVLPRSSNPDGNGKKNLDDADAKLRQRRAGAYEPKD